MLLFTPAMKKIEKKTLYISNKIIEMLMCKSISLTKYVRDLYAEHEKALMKEVKEGLHE